MSEMASSALEAKINKIRQQNEEIKRRYEEVEEDKKNAAKLNALVQMVPSTDWPERKEPPEFSNPPKAKQKPVKEKSEYIPQVHAVEGKKSHTFAQGEGPPPDPKYNFLADSEREETTVEHPRENAGSRTYNKLSRGNFRKKTVGREGVQKDNKFHKGNHRDEYQPGYEAWRAERNRIDEDRISRQRTAEGNWRREWDNDKMHIVDDVMKTNTRPMLGDFTKKDHKDYDRKYYANGNEHMNHIRGNQRPHRGTSKNFHNYENRPHNAYDQQHRHSMPMSVKAPLSPTTSDERTVIATDKSIKVTLNQGRVAKAPVMSVKVNSASIAGTGRVGPRQRTRVTYSHSDAEVTMAENEGFSRQKSFEDKSKGAYFNNQRSPNIKRSHSQKKKEPGAKSPYLQRREAKGEENNVNSPKYCEIDYKLNYSQNKDSQNNDSQKAYSASKSPKAVRKFVKTSKQETAGGTYSGKRETEEIVAESADIADAKETDNETQCVEREESEVTPTADLPKDACNDAEIKENIPETSQQTLSESKNCDLEKIETPEVAAEQKADDKDITTKDEPEKKESVDSIADAPMDVPNAEHADEGDSRNADADHYEVVDKVIVRREECEFSPYDTYSDEAQSADTSTAPIEGNKTAEAIDKSQSDIPNKDDQQRELPKEPGEPSLNDNCDKIKDEATGERPGADTTTENLVPSPAVEPCTVIEATEKSIANDEIVETKEATIAIEKVDANDESNVTRCNENSEDVVSYCETKLEDTVKASKEAKGDGFSLEDKVESQNTDVVKKEGEEKDEKIGSSKE